MNWCRLLVLVAALLVQPLSRAAETPALPTLTSVRQVAELSPAEAARGYPVRLRGVITFHEPTWYLNFIQDATGGIYVRNFDPAVRPGTEVEVEGFSAKGDILSIISGRDGGQARVRSLGPGQWPQSITPAAASLSGNAYDAQWVSIRGTVTEVVRAHDGVMLDLLYDGVLVRAAIPRWPQSWALPGYLRGQQVTVRGVLARSAPTQDGDAAKRAIYLPSQEMVDLSPAALAGLFERPRETFNRLLETEMPRDPPLVRIYGQAQFVNPGHGFFVLMDGGGSVWVQTSAPGKLAPGEFVDAVGWLERFDNRPMLTEACFRRAGPGALAAPLLWRATNVTAEPDDSHGATISVEGRLVEQQRSLNEDSLVLEDQGVIFLARLVQPGSERLPEFEHGTLLRLTGTCVAKRLPLLENLPPTFAFQLWLTSPADVQILQRPSWWTVRRVLWLGGVILLLAVLASLWAVVLRRQVARQTAVIGSQLEREAVAQERTRIARELHDSLGQELVGITWQLDLAAARLADAPEHAQHALTVARTMIRHSQAETKRSVTDLRAAELESTDLPTALEGLLQPLVATAGSAHLHLEVQGLPQRLEGVVEHQLLRIGQEAVANAVHHAHAEKIEVRLCYRKRAVVLEVKDNGRGFDTNQALAIASGHFGLLGLRERANKLQGRLRIESQPGAGTLISVTVLVNGSPTL